LKEIRLLSRWYSLKATVAYLKVLCRRWSYFLHFIPHLFIAFVRGHTIGGGLRRLVDDLAISNAEIQGQVVFFFHFDFVFLVLARDEVGAEFTCLNRLGLRHL
jgi:hypothetical protein